MSTATPSRDARESPPELVMASLNRALRVAPVSTFFVPTLICAVLAAVDSRPARGQSGPISLEETLSHVTYGSLALSPDGRRLAWVQIETNWDESRRNPDLWVVGLDGDGEPRRLTWDPALDASPSWSPDGSTIAFLSGRDGATQIHLLAYQGGESRAVTSEPTGVTSLRWLDDDTLLFLRPDAPPDEQRERAEQRDDARVVGEWYPYQHLHRLELESGAVERLTEGRFHVSAFDASPSGQQIVLTVAPTPRVPDGFNTDLELLDLETGRRTKLVERAGTDGSGTFSPDGRMIAFLTADGVVDWAGEQHLAVVPAAGGPVRLLSKDTYDRRPRGFEWLDDQRMAFDGPWNTQAQLFVLDVESRDYDALSSCECVIQGADFGQGRVAFVMESLTEPPEIFVSALDRFAPRQISRANASLRDRPMGETRVISWKNPKDGLEIEGLLTLPVDYREGQSVPLLTFAHGGPASFFDVAFFGYLHFVYPPQMFATAGYAVLRPNPRGSGAYGEPFKQANRSDWGGMDYVDIQSGIDLLIEQGIADPDRLGFMGWSYGGFMTSWTITQTDRFKAASIGAPVTDLFSFQGSADIPGFIPSYFDGLPYGDTSERARFDAHNPMSHVHEAKTPALVQHGDNDLRVPLFQGLIYYQALLDQGVPTEMVIYPRTGHVPTEPKLQLDTALRNLWWFERWIGGDDAPEPELTFDELKARER